MEGFRSHLTGGLLLVALCTGLAGCGDLDDKQAVEERSLKDLGSSVGLFLWDDRLTLALSDWETADPKVCYKISPSTTATLDGHPMVLRDPGSSRGMLTGESVCRYPLFFVLEGNDPTTQPSSNTIVVSDGTATWTMVVSNYTTTHEFKLMVPAGTTVPAGAGLPLEVLPAAQLQHVAVYAFKGDGLADPEDSDPRRAEYGVSCGDCGSDLVYNEFTYSNAGWDPGLWHVNGACDAGLAVTQCNGPKSCEAVLHRVVMHDTNVMIGSAVE